MQVPTLVYHVGNGDVSVKSCVYDNKHLETTRYVDVVVGIGQNYQPCAYKPVYNMVGLDLTPLHLHYPVVIIEYKLYVARVGSI